MWSPSWRDQLPPGLPPFTFQIHQKALELKRKHRHSMFSHVPIRINQSPWYLKFLLGCAQSTPKALRPLGEKSCLSGRHRATFSLDFSWGLVLWSAAALCSLSAGHPAKGVRVTASSLVVPFFLSYALRDSQNWPGTKISYPTWGYRKISLNKDVLLKTIIPYFPEKKCLYRYAIYIYRCYNHLLEKCFHTFFFLYIHLFIYLFIFGCIGSSLLCVGFL